MNLYKLHSDPESLDHFEKVAFANPDFFWENYRNNKEELKKREKYIAKSTKYAYYYARDILNGPFPAGEEAISKDTHCFKLYVKFVLKKDFYFNGKLITKYKP